MHVKQLLLLSVSICFLVVSINADGYRYSTISWSRPNDDACVVFSGVIGGSGFEFGEQLKNNLVFDMGDGLTESTVGINNESYLDSTAEYTLYHFEFRHCYDTAVEKVFDVSLVKCCHSIPVKNQHSLHNAGYKIQTTVNLTDSNNFHSPIVTAPAVVTLLPGTLRILPLTVIESDGEQTTCTLQQETNNNVNGYVYPTSYYSNHFQENWSIVIDPKTCILSFNDVVHGESFLINVLVNDEHGSSVSVDFIVLVSNSVVKPNESHHLTVPKSGDIPQVSVFAATLTVTFSTSGGCTNGVEGNNIVGCSGTLALRAVVSNGASPYSYVWTPTAPDSATITASPGTYSVVVTDANGNTGSNSFEVAAVQDPTSVTCMTLTNTTCGACVDVSCTISGSFNCRPAILRIGTASRDFQYAFNVDPGTYTFYTPPAGTYSGVFSNFAGCLVSSSPITVNPYSALTARVTSTPACGGASASVTVTPSGGCGSYLITWSPAIVPARGLVTGAQVYSIPPGTYTVTVQDKSDSATTAKGCTFTAPVSIVSGGDPVVVDPIQSSCGSLTANVVSGIAPFTYAWTTNGTATGITTNMYENPPVGDHVVTVTSTNGCSATQSYTVRYPTVDSDVVTSSDFISVSGTWIPYSNTGAILDATGNGLFILGIPISNTVSPAISGTITAPTGSMNYMFGLIAGYDASNNDYFMFEWRGLRASTPCGAVQLGAGLYLLRVPTSATECDVALRRNGVVQLQQTNVLTTWQFGSAHNFVVSYTDQYLLLDLDGTVVVSYWFESSEVAALQNGIYGVVTASQTGVTIDNVASDTIQVSCPANGDINLQKSFVSDTSCSVSLAVSWGDNTTDNIAAKLYTLDANNRGISDVLSHTYSKSGRYVGNFCITSDGYTHCDPFVILIAEWYIPDASFVDGAIWYMYQPRNITWTRPRAGYLTRTVKLEVWNYSDTEKVLDAVSTSTDTGVAKYKGMSGINPSSYKLHLFWMQGSKICPFNYSPIDIQVRVSSFQGGVVPPS